MLIVLIRLINTLHDVKDTSMKFSWLATSKSFWIRVKDMAKKKIINSLDKSMDKLYIS
jgi:hypothetical protein